MELPSSGIVDNQIEFQDPETDIFPRITIKWLRDHCRKHGLYRTPHLNEVLYLQHQGFKRIESLGEYTHLRSLWLDHNHFHQIGDGLSHMNQLKCLFIQSNSLVNLNGIEKLQQLAILDVSDNRLEDTHLLELLPHLSTLYFGGNKLKNASSIASLQLCKSLSTLDLSRNKLEGATEIIDILAVVPHLRVLYLHGNPVVRDIDPYRIRLILNCSELTFLDDRPVRETDRACAVAWSEGGYKAAEEEKKRQHDLEMAKILDNVKGVLKKYGQKVEETEAIDITHITLDFTI